MQLIVIEGADATGTTTQAILLSELLRSQGLNAQSFHHTRPNTKEPIGSALNYAEQRKEICERLKNTDTILIADRWWHSGLLEAEAQYIAGGVDPMGWRGVTDIAKQEPSSLPKHPLLVLWLDARNEILDARMEARGEVPDALDRARRYTYRRYFRAQHQAIDTEQPLKIITLKLAELVLEAVGVQ